VTRLIGRLSSDGAVHVCDVSDGEAHLLSEHDELPAHLDGASPDGSATRPLAEMRWESALHPTARVLAVALNYGGHAQETKNELPERPLFFYKPPSSFVGQGGVLDPHRELSEQFDYEGELGVVIGRECSAIAPEVALDHIAGIVALNDGSARDRLRMTGAGGLLLDWIACKALDRSSAIGPAVAVGPEVTRALRERTIQVETRVNDRVVQSAGIGELIFPVEELISVASRHMTLKPGDVIATGTPAGVGAAGGTFLNGGDRLTINVSLLPPLEVTVG
jgi:2-keto-4-pentenoate hydratase/2-oxohepta-3-ene-1,7-dioic acid hydratase in catechol pathway